MRRVSTIAALALLAAACSATAGDTTTTTVGPTSTTAAEPTTTLPPVSTSVGDTSTTATTVSGPVFAITSVTFGTGPMVVITNIGDETGSLGGHFVCQRPVYDGLPDVELAAGESIVFSGGGSDFNPPEGMLVAESALDLGGLSNADGEIGLYTSSNFGSADNIISYVEWGSSGHGRSDLAASAGIWSGFVPTSNTTSAIMATNLPATSAGDWAEG